MIKSLLQKSLSSVNSQPWHFIIAGTEEGKQRVAKSTLGSYAFNTEKIKSCSHVIAFCTHKTLDEAYLEDTPKRGPRRQIR